MIILYLLIAQFARKFPRYSRRSIILPLEVITAIFWFAVIVSTATLAEEAEPICFLVDATAEFAEVLDHIPVIGDLLQICVWSKVATVASGLCS